MWRASVRKVIRNGVNCYKPCALISFNTIVVFAVVNVLTYVAYKVMDGEGLLGRPPLSDHIYKDFGMPAMREVHPRHNDDDIRLLMKEIWDREFEYEPFLQFKERAYAGKWVNVDKNGFRLSKNNGPWPPDSKNLNIFLFGGSTTFGYGVADDETIASHLQEFLAGQSPREVKVYNFGSGCFFSTQERARFSNLLMQGFVPDVAIFIDGTNDVLLKSGEPPFTDDLRRLWDDRQRFDAGRGILGQFPVRRFINSIKSWIAVKPQEKADPNYKSYDPSKALAEKLNRYSQNKRLIEAAARAYDVRPVFVWQPIPSYRYHTRDFLYNPAREWMLTFTPEAYTMMARLAKENPKDYRQDFLWLADIQESHNESLYVDGIHYTDKFCNEIAVHIGRFLLEREIILGGSGRSERRRSNLASSDRPEGH
jgi:lysophospholipase L1-like esterase